MAGFQAESLMLHKGCLTVPAVVLMLVRLLTCTAVHALHVKLQW